jgi:hypothetical protein
VDVDNAKREAKAKVAEAKAGAKGVEDKAAVETKMANDTAARMEKSNAALMDGVNKILQGLAEIGKQKKTIALIKKDGQTIGANVSPA